MLKDQESVRLRNEEGFIDSDNPLHVSAELEVGDIEIGAVEIKDGETDTRQKIKSDGVDNAAVVTQNSQPLPSGASTESKQDDIIIAIGGFQIPTNDYISRNWTAGTFTETWTFKTGGSGGTTVGTITIVYDDVNMTNIVSVTKT